MVYKSNRYLIVFCDLVGSSEVAQEMDTDSYAKNYIRSFYFAGKTAFNFIIKNKVGTWTSKRIEDNEIVIREVGDELLVTIKIDENYSIEDEIFTALSFASTLKFYWLLSDYSYNKISQFKPTRDIACGLHLGYLTNIGKESKVKFSEYLVGYDINIAKRIEGISRDGFNSHIFVSNYIAEKFNRWRKKELSKDDGIRLLSGTGFKYSEPILLRGITPKVYVSEMIVNTLPLNYEEATRRFNDRKDQIKLIQEKYPLKLILDLQNALSNNKKGILAATQMKEFINVLIEQNNKINEWATNERIKVLQEGNLGNYLENLIFLAQSSGNIWLRIHTIYICFAFSLRQSNDVYVPPKITALLEDFLKEFLEDDRIYSTIR